MLTVKGASHLSFVMKKGEGKAIRSERNSPSNFDMSALTIADLPLAEKARITGLVDRLMSLGREHEETMSHLSNERARHATEIDAANRRIEEELGIVDSKLLQQSETIQQLQEQRASAFAMLRQYQARLEKYADDLQLKDKAEVEQSLKLKMLEDNISQLEKVIENQRMSIDGIESANLSAKKAFKETLEIAEDRCRRASEEITVLSEDAKKSERRCHGLETAVSGFTKQISSMKKAAAAKDEQISELLKVVESSRLALDHAKAEVEASRAAALASASAPSSSSLLPKSSSSKKWMRPAHALASSRTSSEMLLFDTMDLNTEGESTDAGKSGTSKEERKARKKKRILTARKPLLSKDAEHEPIPPHVSITKESTTTVRRHPWDVVLVNSRGSSGSSSKTIQDALLTKKRTNLLGKSSGGENFTAKVKTSLEVELGENRQYDASLLYLLESM